MQSLPRTTNPFALMLDPQAVLASVENSERLSRLHRRICRPLDKPLLPNAEQPSGQDLASFDQDIDAASDDDEGGQGR